jgi:CheY-like chemotaxis protein
MGLFPYQRVDERGYLKYVPVSKEKVKVLLVDDSLDDAFFVRRALERAGIGECVNVVRDGEEAIAYLRGEGDYADRRKFPFPNVILSDVNMPRMSGFELLRWVRQNPECSVIPTILFSSSALEADVKEAYRLGANSYFIKPVDPAELEDLMRLATEYWSRCERPVGKEKC